MQLEGDADWLSPMLAVAPSLGNPSCDCDTLDVGVNELVAEEEAGSDWASLKENLGLSEGACEALRLKVSLPDPQEEAEGVCVCVPVTDGESVPLIVGVGETVPQGDADGDAERVEEVVEQVDKD